MKPAVPRARRVPHAADILRLAGPIAVAQLSQMAMGVTDTVMLGAVGGNALAAGGLGAGLFFTVNILLQGVLTSVSVLVAQARGADARGRIPDIYRTGLLLAALLVVPAFAGLSCARSLLHALGEPPDLAREVGRYLDVLRWGAPGGLVGIGLMRGFLPAIGRPRLLLLVAPAAIAANGLLNHALIHGAWGFPRLGVPGSAAATAATLSGMSVVFLAILHLRASLRPFVSRGRVRWRLLREMLSIGLPVCATYGVETTLFLATGLAMGLVGPAALAAHQIALNVASTSFAVPLSIAQAANVRVAFWAGAGRGTEARRAGFVAIGLGAGFMAAAGLVLLLAPGVIVRLYIDPTLPANMAAASLALSLLAIAALFQVADGVQTIAAGALRGLRDTRVPMILAAFGYWGIGFTLGDLLTFHLGLGAAGLWLGLAAGLGSVASALTLRFHLRTRDWRTKGARARGWQGGRAGATADD